MRHKCATKILGRRTNQRVSLLLALVKNMIKNGVMRTTIVKAKFVRPHVERLITLGKKGGLHSFRLLLSRLRGDEEIVKKIVSEISPRYQERSGGYLRIVKDGFRRGDSAPMAILTFV